MLTQNEMTDVSRVIRNFYTWNAAVPEVIAWCVANNRSFSSGEIAAMLRTFAPNPDTFVFSVAALGEVLRNLYDNGGFPTYADGSYPSQVARMTTGVARTLDGRTVVSKTPPNTSTFIYAPSGAEGYAYDFEVYVPDWNDPESQRAEPYAGPAIPSTDGPGPVTPQKGVLITGALKKDDLIAYVRSDNRLCVPRAAFEAYVALTGIPLRGGVNGDSVYIDYVGQEVHITREPAASGTAVAHQLWSTRGRVAFPSGPGASDFVSGDKYNITVSVDKIVVDLATTV